MVTPGWCRRKGACCPQNDLPVSLLTQLLTPGAKRVVNLRIMPFPQERVPEVRAFFACAPSVRM